MATSMESTKVELIQWLTTLEDMAVLSKLKEFKESIMASKPYILSDEESHSVEEGIQDYKAGNVHNHEDVKKLY